MKRLAIISVLLLVFPLTCFAGSGLTLSGGGLSGEGVAAGGGGSTYIGWPNTNGVPTGTPASVAVLGDDVTVTTKWTVPAEHNGKTIKSIQFYAGSLWAADGCWVVAWKTITGTTTLIGKGVATVPGTNQWIGKTTVVVEGGQSLTVATGDVIYFGTSFYDVPGSSSYVGRDDTGTDVMSYNQVAEHVTAAGPPATISLTESGTTRTMSFILELE